MFRRVIIKLFVNSGYEFHEYNPIAQPLMSVKKRWIHIEHGAIIFEYGHTNKYVEL